MKAITLAFIAVLFSGLTSWAQQDKYTEVMSKNIGVVYKASTIEELQGVVNVFKRIGEAEKSKWEPFYYASFGYIMMATREKDPAKNDGYLDQANEMMSMASTLQPGNSEMATLEGFIHMMRVAVDPASRGAQYSGLSMQAFGKALAMNPNNPRALALMAQMQLGTAQFFKQEPTEACETAKKAIQLFDNQKVASALEPAWGKSVAEKLITNCK